MFTGIAAIWVLNGCLVSDGVASIHIFGHEYTLVWSQGQYQSTNGVTTNLPCAPYILKR